MRNLKRGPAILFISTKFVITRPDIFGKVRINFGYGEIKIENV